MFEESGLALISEIFMPLLEGRLLNINEMETLIQWLEFYIEGYIAYSKKQYADLSSGEDLTLERLKAVDSEAGGIGPHQRDTLLEGIGSSVNHRQLRKRVRDDVVLEKSEMPWRYLVLRVTIRRILSTLLDDTHEATSRVYYKLIICAVLAKGEQEVEGSICAKRKRLSDTPLPISLVLTQRSPDLSPQEALTKAASYRLSTL